jgi:hypothetical protein
VRGCGRAHGAHRHWYVRTRRQAQQRACVHGWTNVSTDVLVQVYSMKVQRQTEEVVALLQS